MDGMSKSELQRLVRVEEAVKIIPEMADKISDIHGLLYKNGLVQSVMENSNWIHTQKKDRDKWKWIIRTSILSIPFSLVLALIKFFFFR